MEYTIDAQGKKLGRVATEASHLLMGKQLADFRRNRAPEVKVHITNAAKLEISDKKAGEKTYARYTGYPGGLRTETLGEVATKKGYAEVVRKAVYGMLPTNKLRPLFMKNLVVTE